MTTIYIVGAWYPCYLLNIGTTFPPAQVPRPFDRKLAPNCQKLFEYTHTQNQSKKPDIKTLKIIAKKFMNFYFIVGPESVYLIIMKHKHNIIKKGKNHMKPNNDKKNSMKSKMAPIKTGAGEITGYIEVFWCDSMQRWVTIPNVSKFKEAN
jgi:hypothetical protein